MNENGNNLNHGLPRSGGGPWWKPGVVIFSEISTWIAVPIVLALIVGKYLDNRYDSKPAMLLILAGVGFLMTTFGIFRTVRNYMRKLKEKTNGE